MNAINRDALRQAFKASDINQLFKTIQYLGLVRARFKNGLEVIASKDGTDWVMPPSYSMRQADLFHKNWNKLTLININK